LVFFSRTQTIINYITAQRKIQPLLSIIFLY